MGDVVELWRWGGGCNCVVGVGSCWVDVAFGPTVALVSALVGEGC
jgi:hypothetical protein